MAVKSAESATNRTLRVAAIQMVAEPRESASNRARAEPLVERAASDGAALVVLPEVFAPGYVPSRGVWDLAEPLGRGPTVAWLQRIARRFGIHVAGGLVETDGRHFFDTFVVCTPAGEIAGRACKANAAPMCSCAGAAPTSWTQRWVDSASPFAPTTSSCTCPRSSTHMRWIWC